MSARALIAQSASNTRDQSFTERLAPLLPSPLRRCRTAATRACNHVGLRHSNFHRRRPRPAPVSRAAWSKNSAGAAPTPNGRDEDGLPLWTGQAVPATGPALRELAAE